VGNDSLPKDAWIGFLEKGKGMVSTRKNVFPFPIDQQKTILTVGACLSCHEDNSKEMTESLSNFKQMKMKRSSNCIVPQWTE